MGRRQTTCNGLQASQLSCRSLEKLFSDVLSETQLTLLCWACACLCSHGPTSISRWSLLSHISWLEDMEVPICLLGVRALVKECPRLRLAQKLKVWPARLSKDSCLPGCLYVVLIHFISNSFKIFKTTRSFFKTPQCVFKRAPFLIVSSLYLSIATDCNTARRPPGRLFICNRLQTSL